jgi:hypothetical protein
VQHHECDVWLSPQQHIETDPLYMTRDLEQRQDEWAVKWSCSKVRDVYSQCINTCKYRETASRGNLPIAED